MAVKECPTPEAMQHCDTPDKAAGYWRLHVANHPFFDPERECFVVVFLNARNRIRGHHFASTGSLSECAVHPRDVFRPAIIGAASSVVFMHNHPSGEPEPSDADMQVTRRFCEAGTLLDIRVIDHVIVGHSRHFSFREAGLI